MQQKIPEKIVANETDGTCRIDTLVACNNCRVKAEKLVPRGATMDGDVQR